MGRELTPKSYHLCERERGQREEGRREGERERENENERIIIFWNYEHFSSGFCLIKL